MVNLKNLRRYSFLISLLVRREISLRYRGSFLGILWTVLNPLMMMMVMNIVFSYLFRHTIENFLVYYLSGQIVFTLLTEGSSGGLTSIISNAGLINKVYIPKYVFPLSKVIAAFINSLFTLVALILVCLATGVPLTIMFIFIPFVFLLLTIFVYGLALFFAAVAVQFRDMIPLHQILMLVWMYLTPIFWPIEAMPKELVPWFASNPMFIFVDIMRDLVLRNKFPDIEQLTICFGFGIVVLLIGGFVFKKKQKNFFLYT